MVFKIIVIQEGPNDEYSRDDLESLNLCLLVMSGENDKHHKSTLFALSVHAICRPSKRSVHIGKA